MNNQEAYDEWAASYDDMANLVRDTELTAKQSLLKDISFATVLELGCGTGKNTEWLSHTAKRITAVDFSEKMLAVAKARVYKNEVHFVTADINEPWHFLQSPIDLITCSLVLEHIQHLSPIFEKAFSSLQPGGYFYIGELHPFKQYGGSKAKFQKDNNTIVLDCFIHTVADFITIALQHDFDLLIIKEWAYENSQDEMPAILSLLFQKK
jgi:ubiquinone/menaquinone biosynthesis C-methylase UbiE